MIRLVVIFLGELWGKLANSRQQPGWPNPIFQNSGQSKQLITANDIQNWSVGKQTHWVRISILFRKPNTNCKNPASSRLVTANCLEQAYGWATSCERRL